MKGEKLIALRDMIAAAKRLYIGKEVQILDLLISAGAKVRLDYRNTNSIQMFGISATCTESRNIGLVDALAAAVDRQIERTGS